MWIWLRRDGVVVVALVLVCACLARVKAAPCPSNAVFLYSDAHDSDFCVCTPGLTCFDSSCTHGSPDNIESFREKDVGFPWTCDTCRCGHGTEPDETAAAGQRMLALAASRGRYPDYPDAPFDEICRITNAAKFPPRALPNATWIHFPKCGTSFTSVLYNYLCQSTTASAHLSQITPAVEEHYFPRTCTICYKPCNPGGKCKGFSSWAPHDGLVRKRTNRGYTTKMCAAELLGVVNTHHPVTRRGLLHGANMLAMFRNPLSRLKSAYNHARHAFGLRDRKAMVAETRQWSIKQWARWPGIAGCQTKMILGWQCASKVDLTDDDLEEAKRRVDEHFAFVGLVAEWNTSVCLFHRMFGGRVHEHEILNLRPADTARYADKFRIATDADMHTLTVDDDPIDFALYQHVRARFIGLLEAYGLEVPPDIRHPPDIYH